MHLAFQLLVLAVFSCSKTANSNENKAYVGVSHVAYGTGPLTLTLNADSLQSVPLPFGYTSGYPGSPAYDTATAGIGDLAIYEGTKNLLSGNAAFQQGAHYSVFAYDSLNSSSISVIIFQNSQPVRTDTFTYIRYLNFSPGPTAWGLLMVNAKIAQTIGTVNFIGKNVNPSFYSFTRVHIGNFQVFAYTDSARPNPDSSNFRSLGSIQIDSTINYNVYLQGFRDSSSGPDTLALKSIPVN